MKRIRGKSVNFHLGCFGMTLDPRYDELVATFKRKFEDLQEYAHEVLDDGIEIRTSWKVHILVCHLGQWLDRHPRGLGLFCEQTCEATHDDFRKSHKRFKVSEAHPQHGERLCRSVVEYSSRRL